MADPIEALKQAAPREDAPRDGREALILEFLREGRKETGPGLGRPGAEKDIFGSSAGSVLETIRPLQEQRSAAEAKLSPEKKRELDDYRIAASQATTHEERESIRKRMDAVDPALGAINARIRDVLGSAAMENITAVTAVTESARVRPADVLQFQRMSTIQCHRPQEQFRGPIDFEGPSRRQALAFARKSEEDWFAPHTDLVQEAARRGVSVEFGRQDNKITPRIFITAEGEKKYLPLDKATPLAWQIDKMVEAKMKELERSYNVTFYRADQPVVKQSLTDASGKFIPAKVELTARQPSLHEMYGMEAALEISKCSLTGPKMKIAFLAEKTNGSFRPAGEFWSDLKGAPTVVMFGDRTLEGKPRFDDTDRTIQASTRDVLLHEIAHHSQHRYNFWANSDLITDMGWKKSTGAGRDWLLRGKNGEFYKVDAGETGTSRKWCLVNAAGEAVDEAGAKAVAGKEIKFDQFAVRDRLLVKPVSNYFDNACEMHAEAVMHFRAGGEKRAALLKEPQLYETVKRYDQLDIDQYYASNFPGRHGMRLPCGQIADRTPENEKRVADFEHLMSQKPDVEKRVFAAINQQYTLRSDATFGSAKSADTEAKFQTLLKELDALAPDMKIVGCQRAAIKENTGKACWAPNEGDFDRYQVTQSEAYAHYAAFLFAQGKPEQAKEFLQKAVQIGKATELDLSYPGLRAEDIAQLSQLTSVKRLTITNVPITKEVGEAVARFTHVETLKLERTKVDDVAFGTVCSLPKLAELRISSVTGLTDSGFQQMPEMKALRTLRVDGALTALTGDMLKNVKQLPALESLSIGELPNTDAALAHLKNHPALWHLEIAFASLQDDSLSNLGTIPNLQHVFLSGPLTGEALKNLRAKNLQSLAIFGGGKDLADGLPALKAMPKLQHLQIVAPVCDAQLSGLEGAKSLKAVNLTGEDIKGEGLKVFKGMRELWNVSLRKTQISGDAIAAFQDCEKLRFLDISTSGTIAPEAIAALQKKLPQCNISIQVIPSDPDKMNEVQRR